MSFTAPASDGGSPITSYTVTSSPGGLSATCPGSPCVVTGLTDGTAYTFTVHATNANGDSAESAASSAVTPAAEPGAPTGASAVAGDAQASVSFTAPASDGGSAITSYTVTSSPGGLSATCPGSPCVVTGLTNGTAYTFTVHATNPVGDSAESVASTSVTPIGAPTAVGGVTATVTDTSATVSFGAPADGGSPIVAYQYSTDNGLNWITLPTSGSGSGLSGTITGLTPGTGYSIILRAVNGTGPGSASAAVTVTTLPATLAAPTAVAGTSSATVSWAPSSTGTVTGYTVYAHPGPASCTTTSISATSCVIGATAGVSYTYTVVAQSVPGDSAASPASNAITATSPEVPASAPTSAPTTLTTTQGVLTKVERSESITLIGAGFLPYSSVTIILYSSPVVLGTAVTDSHGDFTKQVTIPAVLSAGSHNLVATGVSPTGAVYQIRMPVTVAAAAITGTGTTGTGTSTDPGALASTGAEAARIALWAALLTGAGLLLIGFGRRPRLAAIDAANGGPAEND
ncbi:MAG: fibronectin type III domain-containing protein [Actinomycetota bacterium]|nr:fibronectin type III domain-containing protein [Actinomycetota bacterium]